MEKTYIDAHNWYLGNQQKLDIYRGEWIAFTSNGVIAHDSPSETLREREYLNTIAKIEPGRTDFVLARVHEYDCWEPPKFRGVRQRSTISKSSQFISRDRGSIDPGNDQPTQ